MNIEQALKARSESVCELCGSDKDLSVYEVPPVTKDADHCIMVCLTCHQQLSGSVPADANHWRCLNTSMWSTVPAVQVVAWRLLSSLQQEGWPKDLLDMLYLDEGNLAWAKEGGASEVEAAEEKVIHKDSNGTVLLEGDTVVLIKDLDVKGGGFTAKRGTTVKGIALVENNAGQIEGRVNGQLIVILTQFVKKAA